MFLEPMKGLLPWHQCSVLDAVERSRITIRLDLCNLSKTQITKECFLIEETSTTARNELFDPQLPSFGPVLL